MESLLRIANSERQLFIVLRFLDSASHTILACSWHCSGFMKRYMACPVSSAVE